MAQSFQQQSRLRKLTYFGLILLILTFTVVFRSQFVVPRAQALEIREESIGEVELTGSAVRLLMTGSRGFAVCVLWNTAMDKQMRHEWNELELVVNSVTKLQPHFVTPWLFQSWNLAYNVSVESDRVKDKFFYVTRGIELLGEGERRIKEDPDLRNHMAWYYQNKFGLSDEANTFRSLFQMSCIDPKLRDPERFRTRSGGQAQFNLEAFEMFCKEQPHLVRRLRDRLRADTPEKVVEFLADNQRIPGRFEENPDIVGNVAQSPYKQPAEKRFPLLPPTGSLFNSRELDNDSTLSYDTDNFDLARAWYSYAQDPLRPSVHKKPRQLSQVIFEGYPARAQAYKAEYLEKNGWIGPEGWTIKDWFPQNRARREGPKKPVPVGEHGDTWWTQEAWERAYQMFLNYGVLKDMLDKTAQEIAQLEPQARSDYEYNRRVTNFPHFYVKTNVERTRQAVEARRCFFEAEEARKLGDRPQALAWYENEKAYGPPSSWKQPLKGWKKIFLDNPGFRNDTEEQQETYETQNKYLKLVTELHGLTIRRSMLTQDILGQGIHLPWSSSILAGVLVQDLLGQSAQRQPLATFWLPPAHLLRAYPLLLKGPFDDVDSQGQPLIMQYVIDRVRGSVITDFAGTGAPPEGP